MLQDKGKHRKVSAEEKRAELGDQWPVCDCHGEPKRWNASDRRAGGFWACRVKGREAERKYRASEEGREANRKWKRERRARSRLTYLMQTLSLLDRETAALVQKAADDRETANPYEKKMALRILIRKGQI